MPRAVVRSLEQGEAVYTAKPAGRRILHDFLGTAAGATEERESAKVWQANEVRIECYNIKNQRICRKLLCSSGNCVTKTSRMGNTPSKQLMS